MSLAHEIVHLLARKQGDDQLDGDGEQTSAKSLERRFTSVVGE